MEVWDETVAPAMLVKRDVRTSSITQSGKIERLISGEQVTEIEYAEIPEIGLLPIRETRGAESEARRTYTSYITSGISKGRIHSEVSSDGSWTLYEYDSSNRVKSVTVPFGDASPILDDKKAVVGYNGRVKKTEYSYEPVDSRDDASTLADEACMIIEKIGSDAFGWIEVSRNYSAHFVEGNVRTEISERAHSPQATYGAEGNQRTISQYHINTQGAGRPIRRETSDGFVTFWTHEFTPSNVVIETMTVPVSATNGIPFKTTIERSIEDLRGDILREETYVLTDTRRELLSWVEYERDIAGHELKRVSSNGGLTERAWSCCGPEWEKDERGIITDYSYDALGRQVTTTRNGITTFRMYDLLGNVTNETRFAGSLFVSSSTGYDCAGRLVWSVGEDGARTEYVYSTSSEGGEVRTTIQAAGTDCAVTNTVISLRDGSTKATYLNGVLKTTEVHEPFASLIYEGTNGLASARWSRSESDFLGRTVAQSRPGFGGSTLVASNYYDTAGNLVSTLSLSTRSTCSTRLNSQLYFYNELNERIATIDDRNFNEIIDWAGPDLISSNLTHYVKLNGDWWRETRQWSIHDDNSAEARLMNVSRSRITGLGVDNLASESVTIDQRGNETLSRTIRNRDAAEEIAWTKYPTSTTPEVTISTNGLVYSSTSQTGVITTSGYDALQRQIAQTDGCGNTVRMTYDNLGRVASAIDALGYATTYGYDALGRQVSVIAPLTNTVTTTYDAEGRIISQRGATYPVDYAYDEFGEKISMTTYREINNAGDVTRWLRDEATGLVTNKVYADGKGPRYTYTPDGKLATRTWARGVVTTYTYDNSGALTNTVYSDDTPTISMVYDRVGNMLSAVTDGVCTNIYAYSLTGFCTNEVQNGATIARSYDSLGRSTGYTLQTSQNSSVIQTLLSYDALGRIASITSGTNTFSYSYLPGTDIVDGYTCGNFSRKIEFEPLRNLVAAVTNSYANRVISAFDYTNDAAGRRTAISRSGEAFGDLSGATDSYGYNSRNEVISARRTKNGEIIHGFNEDFEYDPIGNRIWSTTYNELGEPKNSQYIANDLNQYTSRTVPGYAAVRGHADADATVTVNEKPTYRYGEYFFGSDEFDNSQFAVEAELVTSAVLASPTNGPDEVCSVTSRVHIAKTPQLFEYDLDGNLLRDGYYTFAYDSDNRLKTVSTNGVLILTNFYDEKSRRVKKVTADAAITFFYDDWNLVEERVAYTNGAITTIHYCWGTDLSGTLQGAGGVGGLLYLTVDDEIYIPCYDNNGNITQYVDVNGYSVASYAYDSFGGIIIKSGPLADFFRHRFSTKYFDAETGLYYYGYRFYSPSLARWLNRDPKEEDGGVNLYGFCANQICYDYLGLKANWHHMLPRQYASQFASAGLDINAAEFGVILEGLDHTGVGGIHPSWNRVWSEFFQKSPKATKAQVLDQLAKMKNMPEFSSLLVKGTKASLSYGAWKTAADQARRKAAKEASEAFAKSAAKRGGKKLLKRVPVVGLMFLFEDISEKGFIGGMCNTLLDACPYVGWGKLGIECITGDWFPDNSK